MGVDGIGSSVVIALAAVLWFIYLVPTWLRRREYLATERNAVRLQQTLRIMAQTAEVPEQVRTEATAREVARQERALREQLARTAEARAAQSAKRLRRSRLVSSVTLLGSLVAAGFGVNAVLVAGDAIMLIVSLIVMAGAVMALRQLSVVARARARAMRAPTVPVRQRTAPEPRVEETASDRTWTPVPLPKPLYLQKPAPAATGGLIIDRTAADTLRAAAQREAALAMQSAVAKSELADAAAESERALRAAQSSPDIARIGASGSAERASASAGSSSVSSPASRFARMGIIDDVDAAPTDLDEILKRRRAV